MRHYVTNSICYPCMWKLEVKSCMIKAWPGTVEHLFLYGLLVWAGAKCEVIIMDQVTIIVTIINGY